MLIETAPVVMAQLARARLSAADIEHVFVSHAHGDHALGFPMLALNRMPDPLPMHVYAGADAASTLKMLWELVYPGYGIENLNLRWHPLPEDHAAQTPIGAGLTLRTAPVSHPPGVPTLAARWEFAAGPTVTLVTDTCANDAAVELARCSDLLIHEASFSAVLQPEADPARHSHSSARQAGEIARRAGCSRLALVHLGPAISEHPDVLIAEAQAETDLDVIVPDDGATIQLM
jgi:ribonuclease BN (tRNA processing enzyme)